MEAVCGSLTLGDDNASPDDLGAGPRSANPVIPHRVSTDNHLGGKTPWPKSREAAFTADVSTLGEEVIVFLIGMRINKPWTVHVWWPIFVAMPKMLKYLVEHPDKGLLGYQQAVLPSPMIVQYWRSFEDLERSARNRDDPHLEPWRRFNSRIGSSGDVGIWHETYRVKAANIEGVYGNMPPYGLAAATGVVPIRRGRDSAAARMGTTETDHSVLPGY